jgi:chromosome segregation ATPase
MSETPPTASMDQDIASAVIATADLETQESVGSTAAAEAVADAAAEKPPGVFDRALAALTTRARLQARINESEATVAGLTETLASERALFVTERDRAAGTIATLQTENQSLTAEIARHEAALAAALGDLNQSQAAAQTVSQAARDLVAEAGVALDALPAAAGDVEVESIESLKARHAEATDLRTRYELAQKISKLTWGN